MLRNLSFSLVFAALALGALEGGLRLCGWPDPGLYAGDPGSVWSLRTDLPPRPVPFPERGTTFTVRTSHAGYRGDEPPPGATLCLGDSTTFGWGVEEDEAWPARLAARLGEPVVNGGVPGTSTFQGLANLDDALATRPRRVLLAWIVRDAELAVATDQDRAAAARPRSDLAILRAIRALRPAPRAPKGTVPRVPPAEYAENLRTLMERVTDAGAEAVLVAFPMQSPPTEHLAAMRSLGAPVIAPTLPADAFFAEDPLHLTAAGNDALAAQVAAALAAR